MSESIQESAPRLASLEAARGIAAVIVILHHFFLAFAPKFTGYMQIDRTEKSVVGEWYFFLFNGTSAVYFFFVLSGYVLSVGYLRRRDPSVLVAGVIKRLPRLALPVVLSLFITVTLAMLQLMPFGITSEITGSKWLETAGFAEIPANLTPSYLDALRQGVTTFFTGEVYYNASIWTMRFEFIGSTFVFMALPLFDAVRRVSSYILMLAIVCLSVFFILPLSVPFFIGLSISIWGSRAKIELHFLQALGVLVVGLYLLGYVSSIEAYVWVGFVEPFWGGTGNSVLIVNTLGAALVVLALVSSVDLSKVLGGRFGVFLGRMSFPIYLVHVPVILSFSCFALIGFLEAGLGGWTALNATLAASILVIFAAAAPLAIVDIVWVRLIGRATRLLVRRGTAATPQVGQ